MSVSLEIKILKKEDFKPFKVIRLESLKNSSKNFGSSYEDEILFKDEIWERRLSNKDVITFGAFLDSKIVGIVSLVLSNRLKTRHTAEIHGMYVNISHQKKGIGYELISTAIKFSSNFNYIEQLILSVEKKNNSAIKLYEKSGFVKFAEVPNALKINGNYHSFIMMNKYIQ